MFKFYPFVETKEMDNPWGFICVFDGKYGETRASQGQVARW